MKKILLLIIVLSANLLVAQVPAIQWKKAFGGTQWDEAFCIRQTTDGGYIVVGYTLSHDGDVLDSNGYRDILVIKLSASGALQWEKSLGGSHEENGFSIQQTTDGGYIVVGDTDSEDGDVIANHFDFAIPDVWIVKLSEVGAIEWQKTLGGNEDDYAYSIQQTTDGGYIVTGTTGSNDGDVSGNHGWLDVWVIKLSGSGTIEWQKTFGGTDGEKSQSIQQTTDGGYIIVGFTYSNDGDLTSHSGMADIWVIKLSSSGTLEWQKTYGGTYDEEAYCIRQTSDGGYIFGGFTGSMDGDLIGHQANYDAWVVKISDTGTLEWQKTFGGNLFDRINSIIQIANGDYIVAGITSSHDGDVIGLHGNSDAWVVKISNLGLIKWQRAIGGSGYDEAQSIQETADGGYIMAGHTTSYNDDALGSGYHGGTGHDFWIVKLETDPLAIDNFSTQKFILFPNPTNQFLNIQNLDNEDIEKVTVSDLTGKILIEQSKNLSQMNVWHLQQGLYFIQIQSQGKTYTQKFIKE